MKFVIAQPCRCGDHAKESGFMYLANDEGAIKFDSKAEAQQLIDDFAYETDLCEEHKQRMAVIPEVEMGDGDLTTVIGDNDVGC